MGKNALCDFNIFVLNSTVEGCTFLAACPEERPVVYMYYQLNKVDIISLSSQNQRRFPYKLINMLD
jgi:hypothetical protein